MNSARLFGLPDLRLPDPMPLHSNPDFPDGQVLIDDGAGGGITRASQS